MNHLLFFVSCLGWILRQQELIKRNLSYADLPLVLVMNEVGEADPILDEPPMGIRCFQSFLNFQAIVLCTITEQAVIRSLRLVTAADVSYSQILVY